MSDEYARVSACLKELADFATKFETVAESKNQERLKVILSKEMPNFARKSMGLVDDVIKEPADLFWIIDNIHRVATAAEKIEEVEFTKIAKELFVLCELLVRLTVGVINTPPKK